MEGTDFDPPWQRSEMGTEEQTADGGGTATASDSLTITDNRTGKTYEVPIEDGTIRATASADQGRRGRLRPHVLRPGVHEHGLVPSAITFIDGERASFATAATRSSSWPRSATYLEVAYLLIHGELPTQAAARRVDARHHASTPSSTRTSRASCDGFRYDAHPMGMLLAHRGGALHVLPGRQAHPRPRDRAPADEPPDRQDADPRRVRLPPHAWGCRTSIPTTSSATPATSSP